MQGYLPPELFHSTSLAPFRANCVSEEAENFKELKFFGLVRCFSVKTEKSSKTSKIEPKTWRNCHFWTVFRNLYNFDWKVAHQTKKFEFLEVLRFFWHPVCPQRRETSGAKWFWGQIPLCALLESFLSATSVARASKDLICCHVLGLVLPLSQITRFD